MKTEIFSKAILNRNRIQILYEYEEKVFEPYYSTKDGGTGLGLAIADRIVAEHGGTIAVADNTPQGSVFIIEAPVHA